MSVRNLISFDNKPDPSINSRSYNSRVDHDMTVNNNLTVGSSLILGGQVFASGNIGLTGNFNVTGTSTFNGPVIFSGPITYSDVPQEVVPVTIQATGIVNTTQVVNLRFRRYLGVATVSIPPFTIASAFQNFSGILTMSSLPLGYRPDVPESDAFWFQLQGFAPPSNGVRSTASIFFGTDGTIKIAINSDGNNFTGGGTGNTMGLILPNTFTYPLA